MDVKIGCYTCSDELSVERYDTDKDFFWITVALADGEREVLLVSKKDLAEFTQKLVTLLLLEEQ